ncbi:hypothetical protein TIFTF001_018220 [Ficus carica]|uniref:Uncharacterized protein n=1 Tax=Ficus carica TaxID=3494 RepID=A0AA88DBF8_FICCA|nr:hypothetical protein TIFTF001_018220 [Ficus carica]
MESLFIVVYEIFERLAYRGILANLVLYLTRELHQGTVTASNNVTNWNNTIWMTLILGVHIADTYLGRFGTGFEATILQPWDQRGKLRRKSLIYPSGADQFNKFEPKEKKQKLSFFNWWAFSVFFGYLISETFVVYIQDNVGWTLCYGLPTVGLVIAVVVFSLDTPFYRHKMPCASPLTKVAKVCVAALRKWKVNLPDDPNEHYELSV